MHQGQSISSHKPRSQIPQKGGKRCLVFSLGERGQGALKHQDTTVPHKRVGIPQTASGLWTPVRECSGVHCAASLPGTTHHRVLQITCLASFLTPWRNHGKNCSLGKFRSPLKSRLPWGYTAQTPSQQWSQCSHSTEVKWPQLFQSPIPTHLDHHNLQCLPRQLKKPIISSLKAGRTLYPHWALQCSFPQHQTAADLPVATRQGEKCPVARGATAERQKNIYKNH